MPYGEGLTTHINSESCVYSGNIIGEALTGEIFFYRRVSNFFLACLERHCQAKINQITLFTEIVKCQQAVRE